MDLLPRDVQLIVWHYLYNDVYSDKVVKQFKDTYIKYWNDEYHCYTCGYGFLNWRTYNRDTCKYDCDGGNIFDILLMLEYRGVVYDWSARCSEPGTYAKLPINY